MIGNKPIHVSGNMTVLCGNCKKYYSRWFNDFSDVVEKQIKQWRGWCPECIEKLKQEEAKKHD
jgi:hypothetical protein